MPKITYSATPNLDNIRREYLNGVLNPSIEELVPEDEKQLSKDQSEISSENTNEYSDEALALISVLKTATKLMVTKTKVIEDHYDMTKNSGTFGTLNAIYYSYGASNNIYFENKKVYTHISKMKCPDIVETANFVFTHIEKLTKALHFTKKPADLYISNNFLNPASFILRFSHPRTSIEAFLTPEIIPKDQSKCMRFFISNDQYAEYIGLGTFSSSDEIQAQSRRYIKQMKLAEDLMIFINTLRYIIEKPERLVEGAPEGYKGLGFSYILKYIR